VKQRSPRRVVVCLKLASGFREALKLAFLSLRHGAPPAFAARAFCRTACGITSWSNGSSTSRNTPLLFEQGIRQQVPRAAFWVMAVAILGHA